MDKDLFILKEIQECDREIYSLQEQLDEIPVLIEQRRSGLAAAEHAFKEGQAALQKFQLKQKEKEVELAAKEGNIKKHEAQLTQVKTNKEYSALQGEINGLKADNSILEEQIIVLIDQAESEQKKVREQQKKLDEVKAQFEIEKKELESKASEMQTKISSLQEVRRSKIKEVDPEIASLYDRIVLKKKGIALVRVEGENCPACQIQLRPQVVNEIQIKEKLVVCENCSRLLYAE